MPAGLRGAGRKVGPQPTSDRGRKERNARQHSTGRCFPGFPPLGLHYMHSQVVCSGCRSTLLYPRGAANVRCALCSTVTPVSLPGDSGGRRLLEWLSGLGMLLIGGPFMRAFAFVILWRFLGVLESPWACRYGDGSTLLRRLQNFAYVYEGSNQCEMLLLPYCEPCTKGNQSVGPYQLWQLQNCADVSLWSSSVKCALCQYVTNAANPSRSPVPLQRPDSAPSSSTSSQTVVVENPMSMDESGKLVSSVVVGITTEKRS
ncbi:hypothetical protein MLD38_010378 [Melastoma candidum]|uniref:Uncharacterized protein n=1 Tax=Melastoma candidum TaxID=119954 RepID=A0ACB9QZN2_9MYRT|nr:hypothetical protein MLD38_010378 [Melastoma candidum]